MKWVGFCAFVHVLNLINCPQVVKYKVLAFTQHRGEIMKDLYDMYESPEGEQLFMGND